MISPARQFVTREDSVETRFFGLLKSLRRLDEQISRGQSSEDGFERAGELLNAVPLTSNDFLMTTQQLNRAEGYHVAGESGAARYELSLLIRRVKGIARFIYCLENAAVGWGAFDHN